MSDVIYPTRPAKCHDCQTMGLYITATKANLDAEKKNRFEGDLKK